MTAPAPEDGRFPLRNATEVALEAEGFRLPGKGGGFIRYADLTHLALSERTLWLGLRDRMVPVKRELFRHPADADRLARALLDRIAAAPGGAEQLARIAAIEAWGRRPQSLYATRGLALLCAAIYLLDLLLQPEIRLVGQLTPVLVEDGDLWRLVTANLLHGPFFHLALNLVCLLVLGRLVERVLGFERTLCVMGAAGLIGMALSGLLRTQDDVVGVSAVVLGLVGALLWIEWSLTAGLPAWWRFPASVRRLLLAAVVLDLVLGFVFSFVIAAEAHLGGFLGGWIGAAAVTQRGVRGEPGRIVRGIAGAVAASTVVALGVAGAEVATGDYTARYATRLADMPGVPPNDLNNAAWFIAIDEDSTRAQLEGALVLAERAVSETRGRAPTMLDTLAEVQFQLGDAARAVSTIDQAIFWDPDEPYYREQRRRFTGDRPEHDRPPDPAFRSGPREERFPLPEDAEGVRV